MSWDSLPSRTVLSLSLGQTHNLPPLWHGLPSPTNSLGQNQAYWKNHLTKATLCLVRHNLTYCIRTWHTNLTYDFYILTCPAVLLTLGQAPKSNSNQLYQTISQRTKTQASHNVTWYSHALQNRAPTSHSTFPDTSSWCAHFLITRCILYGKFFHTESSLFQHSSPAIPPPPPGHRLLTRHIQVLPFSSYGQSMQIDLSWCGCWNNENTTKANTAMKMLNICMKIKLKIKTKCAFLGAERKHASFWP